jgi:endonuclease/exonuclease/phosphatase (EEP) superfamily protein YafD
LARPIIGVVRSLGLVVLAGVLACVRPSMAPELVEVGTASVAALPVEFELLSWNTHKQRHRLFEAELRRFSAGVELLALQEVTEREPVWSMLPPDHAWSLVIAFTYGRHDFATGVATGSVADPLLEEPLLSPIREPLTRTPKSALLTWVAVEGASESLLLVNLHGINFRTAAALDAQLDTLEPFVADHRGPLIVAGDFNTWSRRRRAAVEAFAARHDLISPFSKTRFDDVFVRGLEIRGAEVLRSRSSDHDALRVELRVR